MKYHINRLTLINKKSIVINGWLATANEKNEGIENVFRQDRKK